MSDKEQEILFANHDLRNKIGIAISHLQLLTMENPDLQKSRYITAAVESLNIAVKFTETIVEKLSPDESSNENSSDLIVASVKNQLNNHTKPDYQKMKDVYPLDIEDSYDLLDEDKFIAINPHTLSRLRSNIIHNAINANAKSLHAHYEMREYCIVVSFTDDGDGMTQDEIDMLMLSQHGDGKVHGIGTKFILETAKDHGFLVSYSSKLGQGTVMRILCPYINV